MTKKSDTVLKILHKIYPRLKYYLNFKNNLQLLVAAILSSQVKDEVVNTSTPELFKKYKNAQDFSKANVSELRSLIKNITFAGNKAKYIKKACGILVEKHGGRVPNTVDELVELPGIGRKTANAILQNAFDIVEGIVVDTHVLRVAYRLGWTSNPKNADKSEKELLEIISRKEWKKLPWLMKEHGRAICKAPVPYCTKCPVEKLCPKKGVTKKF